ncbi:MAG: CCDC90 family protein [Candidatus Jidaibacter sp.]|jgi:peptidoglycan hydrolase CwlO-like protein|nr:CCDC90 family protein [Candidatus Jidaibacter sp.]
MYHSFDTLDAAKSFIASGMQIELAETVAKAISASRDTDLSHLATKADLMEVKSEILGLKSEINEVRSEINEVRSEINEVRSEINKVRSEITEVRSELLVKIAESKNEILRWVIGMNIATVSLLMAFFKFFIH